MRPGAERGAPRLLPERPSPRRELPAQELRKSLCSACCLRRPRGRDALRGREEDRASRGGGLGARPPLTGPSLPGRTPRLPLLPPPARGASQWQGRVVTLRPAGSVRSPGGCEPHCSCLLSLLCDDLHPFSETD